MIYLQELEDCQNSAIVQVNYMRAIVFSKYIYPIWSIKKSLYKKCYAESLDTVTYGMMTKKYVFQ